MHRVASRQRLFSWDHFDAQPPNDSDHEETEQCPYNNAFGSPSVDDDFSDYRTCISMSRNASMVFYTSTSFGDGNDNESCPLQSYEKEEDFVYIVSDDDDDDNNGNKEDDVLGQNIFSIKHQSDNTLEGETSFLYLTQDVQFALMSFLDLNALKALTLTCKHFNALLCSKQVKQLQGEVFNTRQYDMHSLSRNAVWWNLIKRSWPCLQFDDKESSLSPSEVNFVVQENQQFINPNAEASNCQINYAAILSQAALHVPTSIDPKFFEPTSIVQIETLHINEQAMIVRRRHRSRRKQKIYTSYELRVDLSDLKEPLRKNLKNQSLHGDSEQIKVEVVQYVGKVGVGDRSIRSNQPFPRPLECLPAFKKVSNDENCHGSYFNLSSRGRKRSLPNYRLSHLENKCIANEKSRLSEPLKFFGRLRSCSKSNGAIAAVIEAQPPQQVRTLFRSSASKTFHPFVLPTVIQSNITGLNLDCKRYMEIDLTPRSIAYFEVSILPRDKSQEVKINEDESTINTISAADRFQEFMNNEGVESSSSCVAIGISTKDYSPSVRMPGWDKHSFAYHSDDGGIFHSKGEMIRVYGPKYDVGDTVGCGVNYQNGGIFFTMNGDFLGYAWCDEKIVLECKEDLFPTVGVDSSNPLALNFGNKTPFVWDFAKFLASNAM